MQNPAFSMCIYILNIYVCSLSDPGFAPSVLLYLACKINNAGLLASAKSKKMRDVSKGGGGGVPEERPYDVSRGQNEYVTLP